MYVVDGRDRYVPTRTRAGDDDGRILEQRIRIQGDRRLDCRSVATPLEVDDIHGEAGTQVDGIDLEPRLRRELTETGSGGDDEVNRLRHTANRLVESQAGLTQREIEGCSLERPPPIVPHDLVFRGSLEKITLRQPERELAEAPGEPPRHLAALREQVVFLERDLLAIAVLAAAFEVDDRGGAMRQHHARDRLAARS